MFVVFVILVASVSVFALSLEHKEALKIKLKNISGKVEAIIPTNGKDTILFLGGRNTKTQKIEWYDKIASSLEISKGINLVILVQLSDLPGFVPRDWVENIVKNEMQRLGAKGHRGENVKVYYDWGKELLGYYDENINMIKIVVVDNKGYVKELIDGEYSEINFNKLKAGLNLSCKPIKSGDIK